MTTQLKQKQARFNIRASEYQKEVIARAAQIRHTTLSDFVLEIAYEAANQILAEQIHIALSPQQWKVFCQALDAPPRKIPSLQKLLKEPSLFEKNEKFN